MALQYKINLIREHVARRRLARAKQQVLGVALAVFGVLLCMTLSVYFARNYRAATLSQRLKVRARSMETAGLNRSLVQDLNRQSNALKARLTAVSQALKNTTSWPELLTLLAESAGESGVLIRKIESSTRDGGLLILIEGVCHEDNPARTVRDFLKRTAATDAFASGAPLSMRESENGRIHFAAEIKAEARDPEEPKSIPTRQLAQATEADKPEAVAGVGAGEKRATATGEKAAPETNPPCEEQAVAKTAPPSPAVLAKAEGIAAAEELVEKASAALPEAHERAEAVGPASEHARDVLSGPAPATPEPSLAHAAPEAAKSESAPADDLLPLIGARIDLLARLKSEMVPPKPPAKTVPTLRSDAVDARETVVAAPTDEAEADSQVDQFERAREETAQEVARQDDGASDQIERTREEAARSTQPRSVPPPESAAAEEREHARAAPAPRTTAPVEATRKSVSLAKRGRTVVIVAVHSTGGAAGELNIRAEHSRPAWRVRAYDQLSGGRDITGELFGHGWRTRIEEGARRMVRIEVTPVGAELHDRFELRVADSEGRMQPVEVNALIEDTWSLPPVASLGRGAGR